MEKPWTFAACSARNVARKLKLASPQFTWTLCANARCMQALLGCSRASTMLYELMTKSLTIVRAKWMSALAETPTKDPSGGKTRIWKTSLS